EAQHGSMSNSLAVPLLAFVREAARYALAPGEPAARRLAVAPFSGLSTLAARSACALAGERGTLAETFANGKPPPLGAQAEAARRFFDALADMRALAQRDASASELLSAIVRGFELDALADPAVEATLRALERAASDGVAASNGLRSSGAQRLLDALADGLAGRGSEFAAQAFAIPPPAGEPELSLQSPEETRNIERARMRYSASALATYAGCPRKWFYKYVCAAVDDPGSPASAYGSAFHFALERFHQAYPAFDAEAGTRLGPALEAEVRSAFERYRNAFPSELEWELARRRALRTACRYLDWLLERAHTQPFRVVGTEETVELELEGYRFIGYIDRVDRDERSGALTLVDYKTGTIADSAARYRERVAAFLDFQLPLYYWGKTLQGARVTRLALVPLKDATLEVAPIELEVVPLRAAPLRWDRKTGAIGIDELEAARREMVALARRLADEPLDRFPVTSDPDECTFCTYRNACRARPPAGPERFGP
ncbi:MAG: RecB family exonuclease, partial [Vulcanimicrobiaceae bacterium]